MNRETQREVAALKDELDALSLSKREHATDLVAIKNLIRAQGRMPNDKYQACCNAQLKHNKAILHIERLMAPIKTRLREISCGIAIEEAEEEQEQEHNANGASRPPAPPPPPPPAPPEPPEPPTRGVILELSALRTDYQKFSEDHTRVAAMRRMAGEFVQKLNPIIKRAIEVGRQFVEEANREAHR